MKRCLFPGVVALVALAGAGGVAVAAEAPVEVAPGTVVRWSAPEADACAMGGDRWEPGESGCWFAVDLLAPAGSLTLAVRQGGEWRETAVRVADYPYPVQRITIEDDSKVNLSAADLERVGKEQARVAALWGVESPGRFTLPLQAPLDPLPGGGRFGSRRFFNDQPRSPHTGVDYGAPAGAGVMSAAAGSVILAADLFFSGRSLFIDHGDGLVSMYFHLDEMLVGEGDEVRRGQVIGRVGQTGRATGPHLHFGLRWRGARIDPTQLLGPAAAIPAVP